MEVDGDDVVTDAGKAVLDMAGPATNVDDAIPDVDGATGVDDAGMEADDAATTEVDGAATPDTNDVR